MVAVWTLGLLALATLFLRRVPPPSAVGYALLTFLAVELAVLLVNPFVGLPLPWLECIVWVAVVATAVVVGVRGPRPVLTRRRIVLGATIAAGAAVLAGVLTLARLLPNGLGLAWAMNGDSANVVVFARGLLAAGGIDASATDTPTPLPFAMIASAMSVGRDNVADAARAAHDIGSLADVWVLLLVVCGVLASAIVVHSGRRTRTPVVVGVLAVTWAAFASWWVLGVQLQFGFVTVAFSVAVLLAAWLVALDSEHRPLLGLIALVLATASILATWSPLAICIVPLGIVIVVRAWRTIIASGLRGLALLGAAVALVLVYLGLAGVPLFLRAAGFLGADGGFPPIGPGAILAITGIAGLASALSARFRGERTALPMFVAMTGGFVVGLGFLLVQRLSLEPIWGYYPAKFAWTVSIALIAIALGATVTLLDALGSRPLIEAVGAACGVALVAGLLWSPTEPQDPLGQQPLIGILRADAFGLGPGQADEVLALTGRENGQELFWRTGFDRWANLWLLQLDVDDFDTNPVRALAYSFALTPDEVCTAVELLGGDVTIVSDDPDAEHALRAVCPDAALTVISR